MSIWYPCIFFCKVSVQIIFSFQNGLFDLSLSGLNFWFIFDSHKYILDAVQFSSVQSLSHVWLFATPMNHSMPGLPVLHQLPEFTQSHVHWLGDAIQPSHPLSSPFPTALNLSKHQGLFKWVTSLHQVAKVLEFQLQHQSFQWAFKTDLL